MRSSFLLCGVFALSLGVPAFFAAPAQAQEEPEEPVAAESGPSYLLPQYQLQRFRPAPGPGDYITVFGSSVAPHLQWNVGTMFNYADDPLRLGTSGTREARTVAYQSQLDLMASVGLLDILEVGLLVPWTMLQRGGALDPLLPPDVNEGRLARTALNDWRMTAKFSILNLQEYPVGLAMVAGLSLPFSSRDALSSDGGVGAEAMVVGEYILWETIRTSANLGFRYRPGQHVLRQNVMGNEVTWGLAAHAPFLTDNLDVLAEIAGALSVEPRPAYLTGTGPGEVPLELKGALRYEVLEDFLSQNLSLMGGFGLGLTDGIGTPDWRFFIGLNGQWVTGGWWQVDYREPGFRGEFDPCVRRETEQRGRRLRMATTFPECPDYERIAGLDEEERLRLLEEAPAPRMRRAPVAPPEEVVEDDRRGDQDRALLRQGAIIVTEQVAFALGSAEIAEASYGVLNDVLQIMLDYPEIGLMRVEGHTDSIGAEHTNLRLSQERAESVRRFLIEGGIAPERVQAIGFGEARPIADNGTADGRALNRRVEFNILQMGESGDSW